MSTLGAVSRPIFSCVFGDDHEEIHYNHLPHHHDAPAGLQGSFYAVCVADNTCLERRIVAGVVLQATCHPEDADFAQTLGKSILTVVPLTGLLSSRTSLLPAKLSVSREGVLSVREMLTVLRLQKRKHSKGAVLVAA